jgi:NAD(P)H-hydrate repair Nnr-like enzyme with NAD(P)H-hydrate epimerase domain
MSLEKFIGSMVSLDCGETLGTYQGSVDSINAGDGTITIVNTYRNGIPYKSSQVVLRSQDIKRLEIVKSSEDAKELPRINKQISVLAVANQQQGAKNGQSKNVTPPPDPGRCNINDLFAKMTVNKSCISSSPCSNGKKSVSPYSTVPTAVTFYTQNDYVDNANAFLSSLMNNGSSNGISKNLIVGDSVSRTFVNGSRKDNSKSQLHGNSEVKKNFFNGDCDRKRSTSETSSTPIRKSASWKGVDQLHARRNKGREEECFSASAEVFQGDFDFETNLAMFNKHAVFEEIEKGQETSNGNGGVKNDVKYRCDENVLQGAKPVYRQIKFTSNGHTNGVSATGKSEYKTDSGLIVPAVPFEVKEKLTSKAEQLGFSRERQIESFGRMAAEMVLQLLGGASRFEPKNAHQCPTVAILCGPGIQSAYSLNCARHLGSRSAKVVVYLASSWTLSPEVQQELNLYKLTRGSLAANCSSLPSGPVDMIITALDCCTGIDNVSHEAWYQSAISWANKKKAQILAIDPPQEGSSLESKWSLTAGLPFSFEQRCGQIYLCDLGIPRQIYKEVGITYKSPFGSKFVIPLHSS